MINKSKEELIELAKKPLKKAKEILGDYDDVQKFCFMNGLKSNSTNLVPTFIVYEYYIQWCDKNDMRYLPRGEFFRKLSQMYDRIKKNGDVQYLISGQGMVVKEYSSSQKEIMKMAYSKRISANVKKEEKAKNAKKAF